MKLQPSDSLRSELKSAGASSREISELVPIVADLKRLKSHDKSLEESGAQHRRHGWRTVIIPVGFGVSGLVLGMALVILSQTVLPGSWLYPVQKLSDNAAMAVHPEYRGTIMMRRAQQVKQLVAEHASSPEVLAALTDYQTEASVYKSTSANYAVFEFCKTSLRQAAAAAPNPERQAINNSLSSLSET